MPRNGDAPPSPSPTGPDRTGRGGVQSVVQRDVGKAIFDWVSGIGAHDVRVMKAPISFRWITDEPIEN
jgi:hypothetical protein